MAGDEKLSVCGLCGNTIKPRGNALKCGSNCEKWFHIECVNISKIEYNNVKISLQIKGVNWTCEPCQELTSANSDSERSGLVLEEKIDKLFEIVKGLVSDNLLLNEKFDNAFDLGKSKNMLPVGCLTITSNDVSPRPMKAKDIVEVHETPNNDKRVSDRASSDLQDALMQVRLKIILSSTWPAGLSLTYINVVIILMQTMKASALTIESTYHSYGFLLEGKQGFSLSGFMTPYDQAITHVSVEAPIDKLQSITRHRKSALGLGLRRKSPMTISEEFASVRDDLK
ncbi:hypothetical protein J6590_066046 [Homalodisca vitripennis]|nr:hypothetical protein J6590_066046 [Homalodisca vitripennis]